MAQESAFSASVPDVFDTEPLSSPSVLPYGNIYIIIGNIYHLLSIDFEPETVLCAFYVLSIIPLIVL